MDSIGHNRVRGGLRSRPNSPAYVCASISSLGSLLKSKTEYGILVTNPLGHSIIVNRF